MTVFSISGSSLDEVWGDAFHKKQKKTKTPPSRKPFEDPFCTVDKKRIDDIMDSYTTDVFDSYDKSRFSRSQKPPDEEDNEEKRYPAEKNFTIPSPLKPSGHVLVENFDENREKMYLDLTMYVFSGIALIFILEQFITLGMHLKK